MDVYENTTDPCSAQEISRYVVSLITQQPNFNLSKRLVILKFIELIFLVLFKRLQTRYKDI